MTTIMLFICTHQAVCKICVHINLWVWCVYISVHQIFVHNLYVRYTCTYLFIHQIFVHINLYVRSHRNTIQSVTSWPDFYQPLSKLATANLTDCLTPGQHHTQFIHMRIWIPIGSLWRPSFPAWSLFFFPIGYCDMWSQSGTTIFIFSNWSLVFIFTDFSVVIIATIWVYCSQCF